MRDELQPTVDDDNNRGNLQFFTAAHTYYLFVFIFLSVYTYTYTYYTFYIHIMCTYICIFFHIANYTRLLMCIIYFGLLHTVCYFYNVLQTHFLHDRSSNSVYTHKFNLPILMGLIEGINPPSFTFTLNYLCSFLWRFYCF